MISCDFPDCLQALSKLHALFYENMYFSTAKAGQGTDSCRLSSKIFYHPNLSNSDFLLFYLLRFFTASTAAIARTDTAIMPAAAAGALPAMSPVFAAGAAEDPPDVWSEAFLSEAL